MEEVKVGDVFGKLTVVSNHHKSKWSCLCECGKTKVLWACDLTTKHHKSCGCSRNFHGLRKHRAYKSWLHMKQRCTNPENQDYCNYGARGITVHEDFLKSFPVWLAEIGERPEGDRWSVGRRDNRSGYTYGNMRWETDSQQAQNHSILVTNKSGITGVNRRTKTIKGKDYSSWVASWVEASGKHRTKEFGCNKFGEVAAKRLATEHRAKMIMELNVLGAEYAASHGTAKAIIR